MNFPDLLDDFPELLREEVERRWGQLLEACDPAQREAYTQRIADPGFAREFATCVAASTWSADWIRRRPDWLLALDASGDLHTTYGDAAYTERLQADVAAAASTDELAAGLRRFRNRETLRIIWRDFNRLATMEETTRNLSLLADACIQTALDYHHRELARQWGEPLIESQGQAEPQRLVVLGMGKLGAFELNLSSDIDLIFAYPKSGETSGGPRSVSHQEFFTRLGQRLIKALDQTTADGFVFRVDMRLRPYGESGALVLSFDAMEEYYQDQGRDWERYAMIKARAVAGEPASGEELLGMLRPFVYRRYIDFSAVESLRSMKQMIQREVKRRNLKNNIKLGAGGIREIEFIAQCMQLIRGGRDRVLQDRGLQTVLAALVDLGYLPAQAADELREAYRFLRNVEHGIQGFADKQTQELPGAPFPQAALAFVMGFADWESLSAELERQRELVSDHFQQVIAPPEDEAEHVVADSQWDHLWQDAFDNAAEPLREAGYDQPQELAQRLRMLHDSPVVQRLQAVGRQRLDAFVPQLLEAATQAEEPTRTLLRILPLVEAVLRRSAYLVLLQENPVALQQLVLLCAASPWIAEQLARHPSLLDELLDARSLYTVPDKTDLRAELLQQLLRLRWEDLEAHMDTLRYFKLAHNLRVAASEVTERLPLMKVSDYLTWIAETILEHVLELAWQNLIAKYGRPQKAPGEPCDKDFIIVGYGKVGGIELGHSSDLDLVFIHGADPGLSTDGERAIDNSVFFTRLGQRIIHILSAHTPMGTLYEVDMRLRPSGESGLLVASLKSFADYQQDKAWTWEHQALVRARVVAGDAALAARFNTVRETVLRRPRDCAQLREDVVAMRDKMRKHLGSPPERRSQQFHLKQDPGGIVDIEFLVQYAVLAWSGEHPALTTWTDNIRILETLAAEQLLSAEDAALLTEAYKTYRAAGHRLALQQQSSVVGPQSFADERADVQRLWEQWLGGGAS